MGISFNSLGNNALLTNGTTAVTAVASPGSSVMRSVRTVFVFNNDTAAATVTIQLLVSATVYILQQATIAAGSTMEFGNAQEFVILDSTSKSIRVVLSGAVSTNQLHVIANWGDYA